MIVRTLLSLIEKYGVLEIFLPFLTIYTLFFALLQKTKILGDPEKMKYVTTVNAVIAVSIAMTVVFFTPFGLSLIDIFSQIFTTGTFFSIALSFVIIFTVMFSIARGVKRGWVELFVGIVLATIVMVPSILKGKLMLPKLNTSDLIAIGSVVVILVVLWRIITHD